MGTVAQHTRGSTYFATAEWLTWKEDWTDRPRVGYGCLMAALRANRIATACRLRAISIEDQGGTMATIEQKNADAKFTMWFNPPHWTFFSSRSSLAEYTGIALCWV